MFHQQDRILGVEENRATSAAATLARLARQFRPYWLILVVTAVLVVTWTAMQVIVPALLGQAVDCYLSPFASGSISESAEGLGADPAAGNEGQAFNQSAAAANCWFGSPEPGAIAPDTIAALGRLSLLIAALYVGSALFSAFSFYLMRWAGFHVLRDLRARVFNHVQHLALGYFTRHEAGDVMSRFTNDMDTLQQAISFALLNVVQGILLIVLIIYQMLRMSAPFTVVSLLTLPVMFIITRWFSTQARREFRRVRQEIGSVNADLQEGISAVREAQAFSREAENIEQFRTSNAANRDANIRAQAYTSALAPSLEALSYVSLALVAAVGGYYILTGQDMLGTPISLGLIIAFIAYTQQFNRPVQMISVLWTNIQSAIAGAERIFGLLDEEIVVKEKPRAPALPPVSGHVRYENVWAEYNPGEPVLKGISLEATPGKTIAIVGPTGAGKTTIINLLPRFWDVTGGRITIDGHDVRDVSLESLREQIGLVLQDTFLFSDTLLNNIRYGRPNATDEEVKAAAQLARAAEFIDRLPQGYETVLGERGSGLSQGQRQLLAIARVALTDPRILILDEATSSVDTRTERLIQESLERLLRGRTSFVIAHRLSTIRNADELLVLHQGQIIERGTHRELLASGGFYHDLYMSQFRRAGETGQEDEVEEKESPLFFVHGD